MVAYVDLREYIHLYSFSIIVNAKVELPVHVKRA
jgi:hypothetical protein